MAKFITLTTTEGVRERINADAIQRYVPSEVGSSVSYSNAEMEWYRETPEQIDAMLGVTESGISMDGLRTMEALRNLIYAAQGGNAERDNAYMLRWLADRLVEKYGESPDSDFIRACRERAAMLDQWLPVARSALRAARGE